MSFGGGFGSGGFGQNNNNNQNRTGFGGGFGSGTNNPGSAFGAPATNTGFGANNNTGGGGLFGGGSSSGFGNTGGFGASTTGFGAKPAGFGATAATTGGNMFGGTATAGSTNAFGGGFGANNNATTSGFGASNTSGGLFGNKPSGFGTNTTTNTSSPFGGGGGFGANTAATGFGAAATTSDQCQGTKAVPFAPFVEKEPNSSTNQQNSFQNICFQAPYQKFTPEELRLADYAQGLRYNQNQGGSFGTNTNFGGFGSNTQATGGFGATNNTPAGGLFGSGATTSAFGTSQPAATGFGANTATTGGGLFGAAKPAGGGLFGAQQPQAQPSNSLFGSPAANNSTAGAFGSNTTGGFGSTNTNTGGGLFGNNNATAAKPGFNFGAAQPAAATTGGFGSTTGGFGSTNTNAGGGLFGNTQQNTASPFGAAQQQPAASTGFGSGFGSTNNAQSNTTSLFGNNNQAKPATGLFGAPAATNTTNSNLFGQPAANNNLFAAANNTNTGAFGKPPGASTGFGTQLNTQNTSSGLFGGGSGFGQTQNNQNQTQQNQGSLFGAPKPSPFGQSGGQGSGLFNNSTNQANTGLFGNTGNNQQQQQQPQQQSQIFGTGSIFGNSQQGQGPQQSLTTSINDNSAFGTPGSMFANTGNGPIINPGPIATPLSSSIRAKKSAALPMYKLNASTSRLNTPTKSLRGGYGLSYSPGSISSTTSSTNGVFASSLLGGNRALSKSMSTNSLRRSFSGDDGILAPGVFSGSPSQRFGSGSSGSMKKLIINRNLRSDLFSNPITPTPEPPQATPNKTILKKQVSFEPGAGGEANGNGGGSTSPLTPVDSNSRSSPSASGTLEMQQVKNGKELAIVHEDEVSPEASKSPNGRPDQVQGRYWMKPSKKEIEKMNRVARAKVTGFQVGREGVGFIKFDTPVNLDNINLDDIFDKIVVLTIRSAEVYPDNPSIQKPSVGHGLNVPSTITLYNSWPRASKKRGDDKAHLTKHLKKLRKLEGTNFVNYNSDTGTWIFTVEHYTVYALDYDDDEEEEEEDDNQRGYNDGRQFGNSVSEFGNSVSEFGNSTLTAPPDTPTPRSRTPKAQPQQDESFQSFDSSMDLTQTESDLEDTFQFKTRKPPPGAFDYPDEPYEQEDDDAEDRTFNENQHSFLDNRSVGSQSASEVEEPMDQDNVSQDDESVSFVDQEMAGSFPEAGNTAELLNDSQDDDDDTMEVVIPGSIRRALDRAQRNSATPAKPKLLAANDWASTLRTTVSPKKQDRALLKSLIDIHGNEKQTALVQVEPALTGYGFSDMQGFGSVMDIQNSLYGMSASPVKTAKLSRRGDNFEKPYHKRSKISDDEFKMSDADRAFHDSLKPSWGPDGTLVYAASTDIKPMSKSRRAREKDGLLTIQKGGIVSEGRDVRFAKFSNESSPGALQKHQSITIIGNWDGVPFATLPDNYSFLDFFDNQNVRDPSVAHEKLVWELASILFDELDVPAELEHVEDALDRLRKDNLSTFWQKLVEQASGRHVAMARSNEEKAIASLSGHNIADACGHLVNGNNFHLATLVAMIGGKESQKKDIRSQLTQWQKTNILAEFSQPIRALYELVAGNACVCDGSKGSLEDRVESFIISKRFGFDWRQAFGMRLWYATKTTDKIEQAVASFAEDMAQDKEPSRPQAWYIEQKIPKLWTDSQLEKREDLLWGLLKLYTNEGSDLEAILLPENSQLSPLDMRLSWQLTRALTSFSGMDYQEAADEKKDNTTLAFASQLNGEGYWLDAVFVLLHLSSNAARAKSIQDHLARHAGQIGSEESLTFATLVQTYKIPASWIWEVKALYMRSVKKDSLAEVECLIKAGLFEEAHRTFVREVAPKTIIEYDYDTLRTLLADFEGKENAISDWHLGGEIYKDFLALLSFQKKSQALDLRVLERLLAGLPATVEESKHPAFMETVAIETMSGVVAKAVVEMEKKGEIVDLPKVLRLPLTEDRFLKHTIDLSLGYYKGVMAGGR